MPKAKVHFFTEKITFELSNPKKTANWLKRVCQSENYEIGSLTFVFCSDAYLLNLNKHFLNNSTFTDILTFDYTQQDLIEGDVFISIPRVKENAKKYQQPFKTELRRVIAHGLLHLLGYNDKGPSQKTQMRKKEEACLSLWK